MVWLVFELVAVSAKWLSYGYVLVSSVHFDVGLLRSGWVKRRRMTAAKAKMETISVVVGSSDVL